MKIDDGSIELADLARESWRRRYVLAIILMASYLAGWSIELNVSQSYDGSAKLIVTADENKISKASEFAFKELQLPKKYHYTISLQDLLDHNVRYFEPQNFKDTFEKSLGSKIEVTKQPMSKIGNNEEYAIYDLAFRVMNPVVAEEKLLKITSDINQDIGLVVKEAMKILFLAMPEKQLRSLKLGHRSYLAAYRTALLDTKRQRNIALTLGIELNKNPPIIALSDFEHSGYLFGHRALTERIKLIEQIKKEKTQKFRQELRSISSMTKELNTKLEPWLNIEKPYSEVIDFSLQKVSFTKINTTPFALIFLLLGLVVSVVFVLFATLWPSLKAMY